MCVCVCVCVLLESDTWATEQKNGLTTIIKKKPHHNKKRGSAPVFVLILYPVVVFCCVLRDLLGYQLPLKTYTILELSKATHFLARPLYFPNEISLSSAGRVCHHSSSCWGRKKEKKRSSAAAMCFFVGCDTVAGRPG